MMADEFFSLYSRRGASLYFGESVTVAEHGLQAAHFARSAGAPDALVLAALLHDIGHLIDCAPDDLAEWANDAHHEVSGSRFLSSYFGPEVYEPVRLHVPAKRYLCATDPNYARMLSPASVQTLKLQGGPMPAEQVASFELEPFYRDAVLLRRCDDQGKVSGLDTPGFECYRALFEQLAIGVAGLSPNSGTNSSNIARDTTGGVL
jgi:phosphonate degradation associated HDIG domain protein